MSKPLSRRLWDFFTGFPNIYSASPPPGRQSITFGPVPVTLTRSSCLSPHERSPAGSSHPSSHIRLAFHCLLTPVYRYFVTWTCNPSRGLLFPMRIGSFVKDIPFLWPSSAMANGKEWGSRVERISTGRRVCQAHDTKRSDWHGTGRPEPVRSDTNHLSTTPSMQQNKFLISTHM